MGIGYEGGFDNSGCILTAENGRDYTYGDKIIVRGAKTEFWNSGKWTKVEGEESSYINKSRKEGSSVGVRGPIGQAIIIEVQRIETTY